MEKDKSIVKVVVVVLAILGLALGLTFLNSGEPSQTSSAVQIPEALMLAFNGVAIGLFTAGFIYIFEKTGIDFREVAVPMAVSFATWAVGEAQGWIDSLPETSDPWLTLLFRILLALVPAVGLLRLIARQPKTLIEHS